MFNKVIALAVRFRWPVVILSALIACYGLFHLTQLPIDAVPDITNRQVQINTIALALAPAQIERQVTYPLETALAGIPGDVYKRQCQCWWIGTDYRFLIPMNGCLGADRLHQRRKVESCLSLYRYTVGLNAVG